MKVHKLVNKSILKFFFSPFNVSWNSFFTKLFSFRLKTFSFPWNWTWQIFESMPMIIKSRIIYVSKQFDFDNYWKIENILEGPSHSRHPNHYRRRTTMSSIASSIVINLAKRPSFLYQQWVCLVHVRHLITRIFLLFNKIDESNWNFFEKKSFKRRIFIFIRVKRFLI